jgi:hypothetical protein
MDEPTGSPPQPPPGRWAWGLTAASLGLPAVAVVCGGMGVTNGGETIELPWFVAMFAILLVSLILGIVVHFWGLMKAFWPKVSKPWVTICLLGIVGGCLTLAAAIFAWMRMFGMA